MSGRARYRRSRPAARVVLRAGTVRDVPLLVAHRHAMWTDIGTRTEAEISAHDQRYAKWVRPRLRSGEIDAYVAQLDGAVVGSGCVWWMPDQPRPAVPPGRQPYVMSMYTEPGARGRGVATTIVQAMITEAKRRGAARVLLHASVHGRSVYAKLGFERSWEMRLVVDPKLKRRTYRGQLTPVGRVARRSSGRGRPGTGRPRSRSRRP